MASVWHFASNAHWQNQHLYFPCGSNFLCSFLTATVTDHYKPDGSKQEKNVFSQSFRGQKFEIKERTGVTAPPKARGENPFLPIPTQTAPSIFWTIDA